jgi:dienelactone hydrolase
MAARPPAEVEMHVYDRVRHLFKDAGLAAHDPAAAELMLERVLAFLDGLGSE